MAGILKIKSATLVETLVAITILSIVAALSISVFLAVSSPGSSSSSMMMAQQKSAEMLDTISPYSLLQNETIEERIENLVYTASFNDYDDQIKMAEVRVKDSEGRMIYQRRRLYYLNEE